MHPRCLTSGRSLLPPPPFKNSTPALSITSLSFSSPLTSSFFTTRTPGKRSEYLSLCCSPVLWLSVSLVRRRSVSLHQEHHRHLHCCRQQTTDLTQSMRSASLDDGMSRTKHRIHTQALISTSGKIKQTYLAQKTTMKEKQTHEQSLKSYK